MLTKLVDCFKIRFKKFVVICHLVGQNLLWCIDLGIFLTAGTAAATVGATAIGGAGVAEKNEIAEFFIFSKIRKASIYVLKNKKTSREFARVRTMPILTY